MKAKRQCAIARPRVTRRDAESFVPKKHGLIVADSEGGLPIPADMARDLGICIGDDYAIWRKGDGWCLVFPKSAKPGARIPKHADWRKVEPALAEETPPAKPSKPAKKKPGK